MKTKNSSTINKLMNVYNLKSLKNEVHICRETGKLIYLKFSEKAYVSSNIFVMSYFVPSQFIFWSK